MTPAASTTDRLEAIGPADAHAGVAVSFEEVRKSYGAARALDGLSLQIRPGEFVALLGPSGCGKTTALRALAGLERIDSGAVRIGGEDISGVPVNRRDLGMVFQSYSLFPNLNAARNVEFGLRTRGVGARERSARAAAMLELVGLGGLGDRYADQLSGGQQQRVALARALVTRPRVLLLDEPLSALDAKVRTQLREEIRRIQLRLGITTVFVTHDQEEALAVADRIAVMNAGNIEQIGTPEELYRRPATPFVAAFIGLSNRIEGVIGAGRIEVLGRSLALLNPELPGVRAEALVRPEDLALLPAGAAEGSPGLVESTSFLGSMRRTGVRLEDGALVHVQHAASARPVPGDSVRVAVADVEVAAG